jgi:hypothetical protein
MSGNAIAFGRRLGGGAWRLLLWALPFRLMQSARLATRMRGAESVHSAGNQWPMVGTAHAGPVRLPPALLGHRVVVLVSFMIGFGRLQLITA